MPRPIGILFGMFFFDSAGQWYSTRSITPEAEVRKWTESRVQLRDIS